MRYVFDDYRLDTQRYELRRAEQRVGLEPKAFDLLLYLVEHRDRVVGRDELLDQVWPEQFISDHSLTARLRAIRQALRDNARQPRFIETVHGRGYRFIASVTTQPETAAVRVASPPPVAPQRPGLKDTSTAMGPVSMVGRESEMVYLHQCLDRARGGRRQVVFVTGEAGLGKTTLVDAFVHEVGQVEALWIGRGQCIEHYGSGEAYLPVLEALERMGQASEGNEMIAVLAQHAPTWLVQMPWLLSSADLQRLEPRTLGTTRQRMLREIARALEVLSTDTPLLLVLEDLHWSDYSTLDCLAMLARRQEPARMLVLGTYRPEDMLGQKHPLRTMTQELRTHGHGHELSLRFLSQDEVTAYLRTRFAGTSHLEALARFVYRRTEGNPFFMVNIVDDAVTRGVLRALEAPEDVLATFVEAERDIPESLRQMLEQRLDRLTSDERHVLEVGSVVGVDFAAAIVAAVSETEVEQVETCCEGLARRGQWLRSRGQDTWPDGTVSGRYGFIHALYQEVAYNRVAPARRLRLHRRIGERLEAGYGAQARELAAELAVHFEEGQLYQQAVQYRAQAAENAIRRSAYQEAAMHLHTGLALLETLPPTPERARRELELLATLAPVLRNTRGQAVPEVRETYARAYALCQQVADAPQRFPVLRGLWNYYNSRAELQTGHELGEQFFSLVQHQEDPALVLWGHCTLGMGDQYYGGAFASARDHYAQAMLLYDRQQHRSLAFQYGQDPGVIALSFWGWMLWMLGYPDQALEKSHDALTLAKDLAHPYSLAAALNWAAMLQQFRRESQAVRELAEAVLALAREDGFAQRVAFGTILRGWALTEQGQAPEGIGQIHQGLAAFRATGQELFRPYSLALLAEACGKNGRAEDGLRVLDEALALVQARREIFWEPEMYRLKGELLLKVDDARWMAASVPESCFQQAIEVARRRQARFLELRAVTNLARLWQHQGKSPAARELLAPIYGWFTEGFDTADLQEARTLLDEL